jgi:pimeloyl-ACP methyl ester carboxylesterase
LQGAGALPLAAGGFGFSAFAQAPPAAPTTGEIPPILFLHGHGDHAAQWITTLWRMESNGVPRERMFAINFTDPLARTDDAKPEPNKSSTEDQRRELADAIKELKRRTGVSRVALVGSSRGGYSIRNHIKNGGRRMSATPCCAARPTTASLIGTTILAASTTVAGPSCAGLTRAKAK